MTYSRLCPLVPELIVCTSGEVSDKNFIHKSQKCEGHGALAQNAITPAGDIPPHCGRETSSTGLLISDKLANTSPHFMVGAQKKTAEDANARAQQRRQEREL